MKNSELYHKTVNILVDAYFNDTLIIQDCTACACGNLVMAANGYKRAEIADDVFWLTRGGEYITPLWSNTVRTVETHPFPVFISKKQILKIGQYDFETKKEIESTGYLLHEFARIEYAFEKGYRGKDKMFNGLMAVVAALDEIHENKDATVTDNVKKQFIK